MRLTRHCWRLAVVKLAEPGLPGWAADSPFLCYARTPEEVSLVCAEAAVPEGLRAERGWTALAVAGPLDFGLTGIVADLGSCLAAAEIPVFVVSTYDTDYVLVKRDRADAAVATLRTAGHEIV